MPRVPTLEDRESWQRQPQGRQVMHQRWRKLLFLHWKIDPKEIERTLPPGLSVDTHNGSAWLGLVPFFMEGIRPLYLPAVPGISNFLEMNVRTYVHDEEGRPGVWFYSLDANQSLAVAIAQRFFHLSYFRADMSAPSTGHKIHFSCRRRGSDDDTASSFTYAPGEALTAPQPGSLEFFLVERYLLFSYSGSKKQLYRGRIHHEPYRLNQAVVDEYRDGATAQAGFDLEGQTPDHQVFSEEVRVKVFGITRADAP